MIDVTCQTCGVVFRATPSRLKTAKDCSVSCRSEREARLVKSRLTYAVSGECWIWTGPIGRNGYGRTSFRSKPAMAHRISYECHVGPIPEGMYIDHLCRVKACINPIHLEPVTPLENNLRARLPHCKHGHPFSGDNLKWTPDGKHRRCKECERRRGYDAYLRRKAKPIQESLDL